MARSLTQIHRQIEKLQRQADALKKQEIKGVIARIRTAIDHYGLTAADLGLAPARSSAAARGATHTSARKSLAPAMPRPVKFRDDAGNTWSGRGRRPDWFKSALESGKSANDLLA